VTDSHCHLDYCDDPGGAADPGLAAIVSVGTTPARCRETLALAERFDNVWAAVGIHPTEAAGAMQARAEIEAMSTHPKVVAIGETGFDFYWESAPEEVQEASFRWQLELAGSLDKPAILHVRDKAKEESASLASARVLSEVGWTKGVLHCFNGHPALLGAGLELGWLVSFAGNLTYKKATDLQAVARELEQGRLLLETDSPFLAPQAKRGKPNRPAYVRYTAEFLAGLRGESLKEVEAYTDHNAKSIFGF
jgi:TatD DNase family protein